MTKGAFWIGNKNKNNNVKSPPQQEREGGREGGGEVDELGTMETFEGSICK